MEGFLTGLHKSPFHGFSVEFAEHKVYNPGDSTKNIDWKLYARTDKLFLKQYEEETNLKCNIIIDVSDSMRFPESNNENLTSLNKLGFSAYAAAALIFLLQKQRDAAGLITFSDAVELQTEIKGAGAHIHYLVEKLSQLLDSKIATEKNVTHISNVLHQLAERTPKRSLICLFTDFANQPNKEGLDDVLAGLQHLKHNKNEVVVFNIFDQGKEIDLNYGNQPHKFIDLETGEELKLSPSSFKDAYQKEKLMRQSVIKNSLQKYGIDYVECSLQNGFNKVLETYLLKRLKLAN